MTNGERLTRIETLIEGLIKHNETRDKWMLRIVGGLVVGIVLLTVPGCWQMVVGCG
jgi:hypothetical protein